MDQSQDNLKQDITSALDSLRATQEQSARDWQQDAADGWFVDKVAPQSLMERPVPLDIPVEEAGNALFKPPVNSALCEDYLSKLERAVQRNYLPRDDSSEMVRIPGDYKILLGITDGIRNPNLEHSQVIGVDGVDIATVEKHITPAIDDFPEFGLIKRFGWDLRAGFILGQGNPRHDYYLIYYYCSRSEHLIRGNKSHAGLVLDQERPWRWRLFYREPHREGLWFDRPKVFDGLTDWIEWYKDWWYRERTIYRPWMVERCRMIDLLYPSDEEEQLGDSGTE